eukprot:14185742-Alexandrium_andersonii.AAC.1
MCIRDRSLGLINLLCLLCSRAGRYYGILPRTTGYYGVLPCLCRDLQGGGYLQELHAGSCKELRIAQYYCAQLGTTAHYGVLRCPTAHYHALRRTT